MEICFVSQTCSNCWKLWMKQKYWKISTTPSSLSVHSKNILLVEEFEDCDTINTITETIKSNTAQLLTILNLTLHTNALIEVCLFLCVNIVYPSLNCSYIYVQSSIRWKIMRCTKKQERVNHCFIKRQSSQENQSQKRTRYWNNRTESLK